MGVVEESTADGIGCRRIPHVIIELGAWGTSSVAALLTDDADGADVVSFGAEAGLYQQAGVPAVVCAARAASNAPTSPTSTSKSTSARACTHSSSCMSAIVYG